MKSLLALLGHSLFLTAAAASADPLTPTAAVRRNDSNFKDMVLAVCISRVYAHQDHAAADAAGTARALVEWTSYDADSAPDQINRLINTYTKRSYRNPIGDNNGTKFDLLKCLDLYHSKELNMLASRVVVAPSSVQRK
ncbi:T6SS amidase immunity protein Tai4 family protein [Pseudoduganella sp. GCM10020061]|uniref:T6SS amidase immunity protein Tai4 family protein n=1 Tax=Pseudoduganella sp. GCM10020061 TaxID=3317345 RepID=UPI00362AD8FC